MTHFEMYLITRLDGVCTLFGGLLTAGLTATIIGGIIIAGSSISCSKEQGAREGRVGRRMAMWGALTSVIFGSLLTLIPTTQDMALIYAVPAIVNNEDVQALPPELAKLARMKIDELLREGEKK